MRFRVIHDAPPFGPPRTAVIAGVLLMLLGAVVVSTSTTEGPVICPFRAATGFPCPSCGLTRSARAIVRGHPGQAVATNPLDAVFLLVVAPVAIVSWGLRQRMGLAVEMEMSRRERRVAWGVLVVAVLVNWAYVLARLG